MYHFSGLWIVDFWETCFELHLSVHLLEHGGMQGLETLRYPVKYGLSTSARTARGSGDSNDMLTATAPFIYLLSA